MNILHTPTSIGPGDAPQGPQAAPQGDALCPPRVSGEGLPSHFDPQAAWRRYYPWWESRGFFAPSDGPAGPPDDGAPAGGLFAPTASTAPDDVSAAAPPPARATFSMVMPPPNVTGALHLGHGLNGTCQDILVRWRRMEGDRVLWTPGVDHASIAVHWVVERQLRAEGTSRQALGREAFLARARAFADTTRTNICDQLRALGISCDWSRICFTLDPGPSAAVGEAFVRLYEDGLIYRALRLCNWDPVSRTTVSDLEVVHEENVQGRLYSFAYPLADGTGELVVATTRPETMLGDTGVAVHPDDPRHRQLIGRQLRHPFTGRLIPVVGDALLVDPAFGTGAVKLTPAHDFNDFAAGQRHGLEMITVLTQEARMAANCGRFAGLSIEAARQQICAALADLGLARGDQPHTLSRGRSERSGAILQPMLSPQWFVRARPLAAPARAAVEQGRMRFVPESWANTYFAWLREVQDWCVSRQLWWGHPIPAWHCDDCAAITVARCAPEACQSCHKTSLTQDPDVLDTWFSSALWPFSTLGWPANTPDMQAFYPTQLLSTSFDIIFFWVARMMMMGHHFTGTSPFTEVYIHALIRDADGAKMSKTKGNVVDPLVMMERYGCDAFRLTLASLAGHNRELRWDEARAAGYHKFINKVWQAFRFTLAQVEKGEELAAALEVGGQGFVGATLFERWIAQRLGETCEQVRAQLHARRFDEAARVLQHFVWNELCDWYLEIAKVATREEGGDGARGRAARATLLWVFEAVARLMHPMMPLVSEEIWQHLHARAGVGCGSVMQARFPTAGALEAGGPGRNAPDEHRRVGTMFALVVALRRLRAQYRVPPKTCVDFWLQPPAAPALAQLAPVVRALANARMVSPPPEIPEHAVLEVVGDAQLVLPLAGVVDLEQEAARLAQEEHKLAADMSRLEGQLGSPAFVARAPGEVVAEKRAALAQASRQLGQIRAARSRLLGGCP